MKQISIYSLVDPRTNECRYVGKTSGTLRTRLLGHLNDVKRGRVFIPRHRWIRELLDMGLIPEIQLLETVNEGKWQQAEMAWIAGMLAKGCQLLNATAGGDGLSSYTHQDATRLKQSESAKRRYQNPDEHKRTGIAVKAALANPASRERLRAVAARHTDEHKARFRAAGAAYGRSDEGRALRSRVHKGKVFSVETWQKISLARKGQKRSPESIKKTADALRGRKRTSAQKLAISEGRRRYYARLEQLGLR